MNPVVKQEYVSKQKQEQEQGEGVIVIPQPQPNEGLNDAGPPPFLTKVYDMVDDQGLDEIVSWSRGGQSFVVWNPHAFSTHLLPRYFKHNNFSSFVRQLNTYGFRKIDHNVWEFANEGFLRGRRHNLKNIKRRKTPSQSPVPQRAVGPYVEVGKFGIDGEVNRLRRDKQILMKELVRLRQEQQITRAQIQAMELRLQGTEKKQQKMMSFLAKATQNPDFVQRLVSHCKRTEGVMNKRIRLIDHGQGSTLTKHADSSAFEMSELDELALEMQGIRRAKRKKEEVVDGFEGGDRELDEEFWEELFNEQLVISGSQGL